MHNYPSSCHPAILCLIFMYARDVKLSFPNNSIKKFTLWIFTLYVTILTSFQENDPYMCFLCVCVYWCVCFCVCTDVFLCVCVLMCVCRQPEYCGLGFKLTRGGPLLEKWNMIPDDTDVLITHGPPIGKHSQLAGLVPLLVLWLWLWWGSPSIDRLASALMGWFQHRLVGPSMDWLAPAVMGWLQHWWVGLVPALVWLQQWWVGSSSGGLAPAVMGWLQQWWVGSSSDGLAPAVMSDGLAPALMNLGGRWVGVRGWSVEVWKMQAMGMVE